MAANKQEILEFLKENALGRKNAKSADFITENLSIEPGRTQEPLRDIVREMILVDNYPIGSSQKGYFFISSEEELRAVEESLERRVKKTSERAEQLRKNWESMI